MPGMFNAASGGILTVFGDANPNAITLSRDAAGKIFVNGGAVPVIGGTSLFGGRGNVWAALLGALVIGSISNGMDLIGLTSAVKYMITGAVLLAAVVIDALSRRQRSAVRSA